MRRTTRGGTGSVLAFAVVAVALAVAGHALGRGGAPDALALAVALGVALGLGTWAHRTGTWWRVGVGLVLVQPLVHVLGRHGALDPRLTGLDGHLTGATHAHDVVAQAGATATVAMLLWHLLAVPLAALALVGVRRSLEAVDAAVRRLHLRLPVAVPALPPLSAVPGAPALARPRPHLVVRRGNAPPCPA